jgi:hypothetical protein
MFIRRNVAVHAIRLREEEQLRENYGSIDAASWLYQHQMHRLLFENGMPLLRLTDGESRPGDMQLVTKNLLPCATYHMAVTRPGLHPKSLMALVRMADLDRPPIVRLI